MSPVCRRSVVGLSAAVGSPIKEDGWATALASETSKAYFGRLQAFLDAEYASTREIFPPRAQLFNAFESCPLGNVKVRTVRIALKHYKTRLYCTM